MNATVSAVIVEMRGRKIIIDLLNIVLYGY